MEIRVGDRVRVCSCGQPFVGVVSKAGGSEGEPWLTLDPVAMLQEGKANRMELPASFGGPGLQEIVPWEGPLPWEKTSKIPKRHEGRYRI